MVGTVLSTSPGETGLLGTRAAARPPLRRPSPLLSPHTYVQLVQNGGLARGVQAEHDDLEGERGRRHGGPSACAFVTRPRLPPTLSIDHHSPASRAGQSRASRAGGGRRGPSSRAVQNGRPRRWSAARSRWRVPGGGGGEPPRAAVGSGCGTRPARARRRRHCALRAAASGPPPSCRPPARAARRRPRAPLGRTWCTRWATWSLAPIRTAATCCGRCVEGVGADGTGRGARKSGMRVRPPPRPPSLHH